MERILDVLPQFADDCPTMRIGPATTRRYVRSLACFARWLDPDDATIDDVVTPLIIAYQAELNRRELAPRTIRCELSAIRAFCRWCIRRRKRTDDPTLGVDWPRIPKSRPRALLVEELRHLVDTLLNPPKRRGLSAWQFARNRRCIELMMYAALRLSEAAALAWEDIDLALGVLWVRDGKGGKDRAVPIHRGLASTLARVPAAERRGPVLPTRTGKHMGDKTIAHIFARWLPSIGVEGITAHRLRHTCATLMRRYGADVKDIKEILGHESLQTTDIYLGPDPERLREAVDVLPDLAELATRPRPALAIVARAG